MLEYRRYRFAILFLVTLAVVTPSVAGPQALFTTGPQGQAVNQNVYSSRLEVYINGGPGGGLEPGDYVFQVTNPSGAVLLSSDPAACRVFRVADGAPVALRDLSAGVLVDHAGESDACHVANLPDGVAGSHGRHDTNEHAGGGGIVIQLMPFSPSPNEGGVYKAWILPLATYLAQGGDLELAPAPVEGGFARDAGFSANKGAKTDNFKVTDSSVDDNRPPVADAGPDRTVAVGSTVALDGSGSTDPDGDPLTFAWAIVSTPMNSAATLSPSDAVMPELVTDLPGTYVLSLIVNDGTIDSAADQVAITTGNSPPVAEAGSDQSTILYQPVTLDGSGSTDVDGDTLTYAWSVVSAPAGSFYLFVEPTDIMPLFYHTDAGSYVVQLVVNDGQVDSAPDTMIVSTLNTPPVARAGSDQTATLGTTVTLDGSLSFDLDGDQLSFAWSFTTIPAGSAATLSDSSAVMPQFDLDLHGVYVAQLIVDDGEDVSIPDTVTIATINTAPTADAGPDQTVLQGDTVVLDGTGSSDPELDPLLFTWSLLSVPANSTATLSDTGAAMPTFQADRLGDYVAQLIVHDGLLDSTPDTVLISTANVPPVADAGPDQTLDAGTFLELDGSGSSDADGDPLTYFWSIVSAPPSSLGLIFDTTSAQPSYLLDAPGTHVLQLIVNDGTVSSTPDTVVIESLPTQRVLLIPESDLIGLGRTVPATVRLLAPPPPGGVVVTLSAADPSLVGITPSSVTIPQGSDSAPVTLDGLILGHTVLHADAPGYTSGTAAVSVTDFLISIEQGLILAPGETSSLAVSLSSPAPFGGQTLFLSSADPNIASITPSVFVPEGSQIPSSNPQVTGGRIGMVEIHGSAGGFAPDTSQITVTIDIWFSQSQLRLPLETREVTLNLSAPAPAGLTLDVGTDDPGIATVPATVTPVAGTTTVQVPVTGLADGSTTLRVSAPGLSEATMSIDVGSGISLVGQLSGGQLFVGADLQHRMRVRLASPAPPAGRNVTVTSTDPSGLLLSAAPSDPGSATVSILVPGGDTNGLVWVHGLAGSGVIEVTTSAPAHTDGSDTIRLFPSGFVFETADFETTTLSPDVPVILGTRALDPVSLEPIWTTLDGSALRVGLNVAIDPVSSDPAVGIILGNPLTFNGGDARREVDFDPLGAGQTTLSMATPAGFNTPASLTTIDATVSIPPIHIGGHPRVGYQLQERLSVTLGTAPPAPVDITVSVDDPSIVLVSDDEDSIGAASVVLPGSAPIHLQGLAPGTVTLTVEAPGYATTTRSIEVVPSGFRFHQFVPPTITTITLAPNVSLAIEAEVINPQIANVFFRARELRPGVTLDVAVTSSDPAVAAVLGSPVVATHPGMPLTVEVDPLTEGVATIQIVQPPGFSTPGGRSQTTVSVSAPGISILPNNGSDLRIGRDLQQAYSFVLGATPPSPVDVTITLGSATIASLTDDPALDGSDTLVIPGVTASGLFTLQGKALGTTTVTVSATGFAPVTRAVEVTPSGFEISTSSFPLSTFDPNRTVTVRPVALDATSLERIDNQPLRPGVSAQVDVVSSDPAVAGITASPLGFSPGVLNRTTQLDPLTAGTTTVTAVPPAGFDMPATTGQFVVTITAPDVVISAFAIVGVNLQARLTVSLADPPPGPVDVTITSLAPSIGILSVDRTIAGGSDVTFTGVTGTFVGYVYFQAVGVGGTQVVAQAAGYNDATRNFTVGPSGFVFEANPDLTTSVSAPNTGRNICTAPLDSTTLEAISLPPGSSQSLRGGMTVAATVSNADPSVAATVGVPVNFTDGQSCAQFEIDPIAVGSTVLTVDPVTGFDTPAILDRELVVIVNP